MRPLLLVGLLLLVGCVAAATESTTKESQCPWNYYGPTSVTHSHTKYVNASKVLYVYDYAGKIFDKSVTMASVAGSLAKANMPSFVLVDFNMTSKIPDAMLRPSNPHVVPRWTPDELRAQLRSAPEETRWLDELHEYWGVTLNMTFQNDFVGMMGVALAKIPKAVYVLVKSTQSESLSVGLMRCAQLSTPSQLCMVATPVIAVILNKAYPQITMAENVTSQDLHSYYSGLMKQPGGICASFQGKLGMVQPPTSFPFLADYAVYANTPIVFNFSHWYVVELLVCIHKNKLLNETEVTAGIWLGFVDNEFKDVNEMAGAASAVACTNFAMNLATYQFYRVDSSYQPIADDRNNRTPHPAMKELPPPAKQKHMVAFVFTDGDNLCWMENVFYQPQWYGSPKRGQVPISWTISESMRYLAPNIYHRILRDRTPNDTFVGAASGFAYYHPKYTPDAEMDRMAKASKCFSDASGFRTTNILDGNADNATAWRVTDHYLKNGFDSVFYYPWGYGALGGVGGRPFNDSRIMVTPRYQLWDGIFLNASTMIPVLNSQPINMTSMWGYSVIDINVWASTLEEAWEVMTNTTEHVEVVSLDDLIDMMSKHVVDFPTQPPPGNLTPPTLASQFQFVLRNNKV